MEDIAAAVDAIGVEPVGIVFGLGMTPWVDDDQRDRFLNLLKGESVGD